MTTSQPHQDEEIDLLELLLTLWRGKWILILFSIAGLVLGGGIIFLQPNSFKASVPLSMGNSTTFTKYTSINELLRQNAFTYQITRETIFERFVTEFEDYHEVVAEVTKVAPISNEGELTQTQRANQINNLAKKFEIVPPTSNNKGWQMNFEWNDVIEGKLILKSAASRSLQSVKIGIEADLQTLIQAVRDRVRFEKESIENELGTLQQLIQLDNKKRLLFLAEQSTISKELGIERNTLDAVGLAQSQANGIAVNLNSTEVPFYLRGYKAIDKEIDLITLRTEEENFAQNNQYVQLQKRLVALNNNIAAAQLTENLAVLSNDDPLNWVVYDVDFASAKSTKRTLVLLVLALLSGGFTGVVVVFVRNAIQKRKL